MSQGIINHRIIVLDASSSMSGLAHDVIKVADAQVAGLAERSKFHDQETRISVFSFSSPMYHGNLPAKCLLYEKDVLRMPSIAGMYEPKGNTALCGALTSVIADMRLTPEKYGDHSFWLDILTDGYENASLPSDVRRLPDIIRHLPGNWTLAGFVPHPDSRRALMRLGFPEGNISTWNPEEEDAVRDVGVAMAAATDMYMTLRTTGTRSVTNLYSMSAPSASTLKKTLTPVTPGAFYFENVNPEDLAQVSNARIDEFMQLKTGKPYNPDRVFYEMTKRERIQDYKKVAVAIWDKNTNSEQVYTGSAARSVLGLPDSGEVRVSPGRWAGKGYKVFIQTTSFNRKLVPGTRVLILR